MKTDVAIIGAGPGGTSAAMFLAKHGINSLIIEKDRFPRYHIGESMTGETGVVARSLDLESKLLAAKYPIKRGVKVYGTGGKNSWFVPVMGRDEAWNLFPQFTWQVPRSEFDELMLQEAVGRGATLLQARAEKPILKEDGSVGGVQVQLPSGKLETIESRVLIDVSGISTFLASSGVTGPKYRGNYDRQIAIFSQVANADRGEGQNKNDTLIFYQEKYHWAWFIPIDDEIVSVGVVVPAAYFKRQNESKRDFLIRELQDLNPELQRRIPEVKLVEDVRAIVNYSYQVRGFTGKGFICIGDAHRFVDPVFSFGLFVTMKEAELAASTIEAYLNDGVGEPEQPFLSHEFMCEMGIDILEDVIDSFWEYPLAFARMVHEKHVGDMVDIFSGRVFERQPSAAVVAIRELLERVRSYHSADLSSPPIGSRFQPERATIWEPNNLGLVES